MITMTAKTTAEFARDMVKYYLRNNDFEIVEENFKCKTGKIEFICEEEGELVLIGVKGRRSCAGFPDDDTSDERRGKLE